MASPPIRQLDGPGGYLRWKESVLLRVRTLGVARVLFEDPPPTGCGGQDEAAAAKKWARDDEICRGHILATLSDRLFPVYARHATARAVWEAVACTYDVETPRRTRLDRFQEFQFDAENGDLLGQLAHAEALGVAAKLLDDYVAYEVRLKLPQAVRTAVTLHPDCDKGMSVVWEVARRLVSRLEPELLWTTIDEMAEDDDGEDHKPGEERVCWNCGEPGHIARNCSGAGHNARRLRRGA